MVDCIIVLLPFAKNKGQEWNAGSGSIPMRTPYRKVPLVPSPASFLVLSCALDSHLRFSLLLYKGISSQHH